MSNLPVWVQAGLAALLILAAVVAFGVHQQDGVAHNRASLERLHGEIQDVDNIVRDNQQRLAHIEALLNGRRDTGNIEAGVAR